MPVIIFIRHGKALSNQMGVLNNEDEGYPLVEEGVTTTTRTATELKKLKVSKLYSSPVLRARQTAEIIGNELGLKPILDERLRDRGYGEMINKPVKDGEWLLDVDWSNTSVETHDAVKKRILSFVDSISGEKGVVVVVSHDNEIKAMIASILNVDFELMHFGLKVTNARMTVVSTSGTHKLLAANYPALPGWLVSRIERESGMSRSKSTTKA